MDNQNLLKVLKSFGKPVQEAQTPSVATTSFAVAGVSFEERQNILKDMEQEHLASGRRFPATLQPEPENQYDSNAIAVLVSFNGVKHKIGYVPKSRNVEIASKIDKSTVYVGSIGKETNNGQIGVQIIMEEQHGCDKA